MDAVRLLLLRGRFLLSKLYVAPLKRAFKQAGIHDYLKRLYRSIDVAEVRQQSFSVGGHTVVIETETVRQYEAVKKYQGEEKPIIYEIVAHLRPGDVFYDVGAWIGTYACLVGKARPDVEVHAFEPGVQRAAWLRRNLDLNGVRATVHARALSAQPQALYLGENAALTEQVGSGNEAITAVNGDAYLEREAVPPPTVMKMDINGTEVDALRGLERTIGRDACRLIYCEVHPHMGVDGEELCSLLEGQGFRVERVAERGAVYFIRASKNAAGAPAS